ncbi:hypothetical protein BGY98DRAFT_963228 [Russula aff. rugulosa BPL654]|nr:hypothetical protein BGY98DRAFT_963228 [Russula aff. rugulosa BPL654]
MRSSPDSILFRTRFRIRLPELISACHDPTRLVNDSTVASYGLLNRIWRARIQTPMYCIRIALGDLVCTDRHSLVQRQPNQTLVNDFDPIIALIDRDTLSTEVLMEKETRMYTGGKKGENTLDSNPMSSTSEEVASIHLESLLNYIDAASADHHCPKVEKGERNLVLLPAEPETVVVDGPMLALGAFLNCGPPCIGEVGDDMSFMVTLTTTVKYLVEDVRVSEASLYT